MEYHGHAEHKQVAARSEAAKLVLQIHAFLPPDCSDRVEARLLDVPGVRAASLNPMMGTVTVTLAPGGSPEAVVRRLREVGVECGARPSTVDIAAAEHRAHATGRLAEHDHHAMMEQEMRRRFLVVLGLAIPVLILSPTIQSWAGYRLPDLVGLNFVLVALASIIVLYGGVPFYRGAATALRARTADMDVLVSLAVLSGYLYSVAATFLFVAPDFYWEVSTLVLFLLFGHWMEMRSVRGASGALRELVKLIPPSANRVKSDGSIEEVETASLALGDVVLVRPGEKVPIDGIVLEGVSSVNEALVTGESKPVSKDAGDTVLGGTINGEGALRVRVAKTGEETALAQIVNLVREAQESKPPVQRLADRAATALTLIAVTLGIVTFAYWFGVARADSLFALTLMITVFVIACPHALGLAIPTVTVISTTMGAQRGLLIRNAEGLETARDLDIVLFDKTGTLTTGRFGVTDVIPFGSWSEADLLRLAAGVERNSEHVIGKAIVAHAESRGVSLPDVVDFTALPGKGARAKADRHAVVLGNRALLDDLGLEPPAEADRLAAQGKTIVHAVVDDRLAGVIALADVIRDESGEAVADLKSMGIRVAMLTGDNRTTAAYVAGQLGLDTFFAEVPGARPSGRRNCNRRRHRRGDGLRGHCPRTERSKGRGASDSLEPAHIEQDAAEPRLGDRLQRGRAPPRRGGRGAGRHCVATRVGCALHGRLKRDRRDERAPHAS